MKSTPEILRQAGSFNDAMQSGKMKWQKKRSKNTHLTKSKKRK